MEMSPVYHLWLEERAKGPFTLGQLRAMWNGGQITRDTLYVVEGGSEWCPLSDIIGELEPAIDAADSKTVKVLEEINRSQEVTKNNAKFVGCFLFGVFALVCGLAILFFFSQMLKPN
jgi:hypothetical protein